MAFKLKIFGCEMETHMNEAHSKMDANVGQDEALGLCLSTLMEF